MRRLTFSEARKLPILEFRLADILTAMELTMPQFVDLCILCGCDYTDTIRGIGPKNALKLIKTHGSIEKVLESLDTTKYPLPESFDYAQVCEVGLLVGAFTFVDTLPDLVTARCGRISVCVPGPCL